MLRIILPAAVCVLGSGVVACGSNNSGAVTLGAMDASSDVAGDASMGRESSALDDVESQGDGDGDGDGDDGAGEDASPAPPQPATEAIVRFANWSADSPAIDFCLASHGTGSFEGPFVAQHAAAFDDAGDDAGTGALSFPDVTAYLALEPGQYDVRLVTASAGNCAAGILSDATNLAAWPAGTAATIALIGAPLPANGEPGLAVVEFIDYVSTDSPTPDAALTFNVRSINAEPEVVEADFGTIVRGAFQIQPSLSTLPYGTSSQSLPALLGLSPGPDLGYTNEGTVIGATFGAAASVPTLRNDSVGTILASAPNLSIGAGADVTFVLVARHGPPPADAGSRPRIDQLIECVDNAGTLTLEGTCQVVSP